MPAARAPPSRPPKPYTGARDRSAHPLARGGSPVATKIVVSPKFPAAMLEIARSFVPAGYEMVVVDAGTPEFTAALPDAAYYVGFPRPELNSEFFKAASGLKLVQLISAGYDRLDVAAAKRAGVPVANNGGADTPGGGGAHPQLVFPGSPQAVPAPPHPDPPQAGGGGGRLSTAPHSRGGER